MALQNVQYIPSWSPWQACLSVLSAHHDILSLLFIKPHRTGREANSKAVMYIPGLVPFRTNDVGRKEVDILRLGLEVILLEAVAFWISPISRQSN
jgi:hypothetical protein